MPQTGRRSVRSPDLPLCLHIGEHEVVVGVQADVLPCVHHVQVANGVEDEACVEHLRCCLRVGFVDLDVPSVGLT